MLPQQAARSLPAKTEGSSVPMGQFYFNHETSHSFWARKAKLEHSLCLILTRSHSTSSVSFGKLQASDGRIKVEKTKSVHFYHSVTYSFQHVPDGILTPNLIFLLRKVAFTLRHSLGQAVFSRGSDYCCKVGPSLREEVWNLSWSWVESLP